MTPPRFPGFAPSAGGYESYYVRAVDPAAPRALWLRHTIHQAPGEAPVGSIWATLFDATDSGPPAPATAKLTLPMPEPLADGVRLGASTFTAATGVRGAAGDAASWDLTWSGDEPPLRHLPRAWMYKAPLPRTKLESPLPAAHVGGRITVGDTTFEAGGWPGMVGHNWGSEHAERWIWLHGVAFDDRPGDWLDLSLGRVKLGGRATTPWVANGAVCLNGERHTIGGLRARPKVGEGPGHLDLRLEGPGTRMRLTVHSVLPQTVVWRYADPDGDEHHVANCSIAELEAVVTPPQAPSATLRTAHGAAYELGMRETTHGLRVQPFPDP